MKLKYVLMALVLVVVAGVGLWAGSAGKAPVADYSDITTYEQCLTAGFGVVKDNPDQCKTPDGQVFTRSTSGELSDLIQVDAPADNAVVGSPLVVSGSARGSWYFEGSFPIELLDADGASLFAGPVKAQGDWMTSAFVPFSTKVTFRAPQTSNGVLILRKDNPSGLAENEKEIRIPVRFASVSSRNVSFNTAITLKEGERVGFSDGLVVALRRVEDSRCKAGVQCVWAGELVAVLQIGELKDEIRLGTTNVKSLTYGSYVYTLKSATETTATITVSKASASAATSGVSGYVHVGPTCPVEKVPADPKCADKPGVDLNVLIKREGETAAVASLTTDDSGRFRASLPAGSYIASVDNGGAALPNCAENSFKIKSGEFTVIDISCDSGIR